eukprot:s183_g8.t1
MLFGTPTKFDTVWGNACDVWGTTARNRKFSLRRTGLEWPETIQSAAHTFQEDLAGFVTARSLRMLPAILWEA